MRFLKQFTYTSLCKRIYENNTKVKIYARQVFFCNMHCISHICHVYKKYQQSVECCRRWASRAVDCPLVAAWRYVSVERTMELLRSAV